MVSSFISFGLALLVAMQSTTSDPDEETKAKHSGGNTVVETPVDVQDRETDSRHPSRSITGPQRPEGRASLAPRRSRRNVVDEGPRVEDSASRRRTTLHVPAGERETIVVHLHHIPAVDTAETIREWLESEEMASNQVAANVVAVVISNDLVVSGTSEQLETIRAVVLELDRPTPQIHVKAMLVDLTLSEAPKFPFGQSSADVSKRGFIDILAKLKERGDLRVLVQPELLCADNQPAFLQYGSRVPRVTGASAQSRGRTMQVTLEDVGTILGVTGRVTEDNMVTLEIDLERSHLGPKEEGTPVATSEDGSVVRSQQVEKLKLQTTVSLRGGQTVVLGGMVYKTDQRWGELLLFLQPEIVQ